MCCGAEQRHATRSPASDRREAEGVRSEHGRPVRSRATPGPGRGGFEGTTFAEKMCVAEVWGCGGEGRPEALAPVLTQELVNMGSALLHLTGERQWFFRQPPASSMVTLRSASIAT
jgi:hypothetical protein